MKHYKITLDDQIFDVEVLDDPRKSDVQVRVNGEVFTVQAETVVQAADSNDVQVQPVITGPAVPQTAGSEAVSATVVKAPLPGVIKSVVVHTGQHVAANDELCVIEAMKAMNVIRATREGTIGQVYVVEGRQIAYGAPLLDLC